MNKTYDFIRHNKTEQLFKVNVNKLSGLNCLMLHGQLGHCGDLITFATGGLYWEKELKKAHEAKVYNGPKEFTVENWEIVEEYHLKHVSDTLYTGVTWIYVNHFDVSGGAGDCSGYADFMYEKSYITERNDEECIIPEDVQYPQLYISQLVEQHRRKTNARESGDYMYYV